MAFLSASDINTTSPYKVKQVDDLSVRFTTRYGVHYVVGFTKDVFIFNENGYFFYIIAESHVSAKDSDIYSTIVSIIDNFFGNAEESAIIYICSNDDNKQKSRARLFASWFTLYKHKSDYSLVTYTKEDNGKSYYYGLLLKKSNPNHDIMIDIFKNFLEDN